MRHLAREFSSNRRWYTCQSMPPSKKPSVWSRHIPRVMKNTWHIEKSIGKTLQKWSQKLSSSFSPVWHTSQTSKLFLFANLPLMKLSKHSRWSMLLHWQGRISSWVLFSLLQWRHRIGAIENIETGCPRFLSKTSDELSWNVGMPWDSSGCWGMWTCHKNETILEMPQKQSPRFDFSLEAPRGFTQKWLNRIESTRISGTLEICRTWTPDEQQMNTKAAFQRQWQQASSLKPVRNKTRHITAHGTSRHILETVPMWVPMWNLWKPMTSMTATQCLQDVARKKTSYYIILHTCLDLQTQVDVLYFSKILEFIASAAARLRGTLPQSAH